MAKKTFEAAWWAEGRRPHNHKDLHSACVEARAYSEAHPRTAAYLRVWSDRKKEYYLSMAFKGGLMAPRELVEARKEKEGGYDQRAETDSGIAAERGEAGECAAEAVSG